MRINRFDENVNVVNTRKVNATVDDTWIQSFQLVSQCVFTLNTKRALYFMSIDGSLGYAIQRAYDSFAGVNSSPDGTVYLIEPSLKQIYVYDYAHFFF